MNHEGTAGVKLAHEQLGSLDPQKQKKKKQGLKCSPALRSDLASPGCVTTDKALHLFAPPFCSYA